MNYYSGVAPANGHIFIRIRDDTEEFKFNLLTPIGLAGETEVPYILGTLTVTENLNGDLEYSFAEWKP